ncbi:MAG: hypothetical protein DRQ01_08365, partial [Ignavibacteriae bacterium]
FKEEIIKYLDFGGNFLYTGYRPSKAFEKQSGDPVIFEAGDFIYDYLKIAESRFKVTVLFIGAIQEEIEYNNIFVDSSKTLPAEEYHIRHIESITSSTLGIDIYTFETFFDSTTIQGSFKGKPVGVEYIGTDYKTVTLSFPLYYMNLSDAKELTEQILTNKFEEVMPVEKDENVLPSEYSLSQNYPNPFNPGTVINFSIPNSSFVTIKIYDVLGNEVVTLVSNQYSIGNYEVVFNASSLPSGIYFYQLRAEDFVKTKKMVLIK